MKRSVIVALSGLVVLLVVFASIRASADDKSVDARILKLEQRVATLEQDNAKLREVLKVDNKKVTVEAQSVLIKSATALDMRADTNFELKANGPATIKGSVINLN